MFRYEGRFGHRASDRWGTSVHLRLDHWSNHCKRHGPRSRLYQSEGWRSHGNGAEAEFTLKEPDPMKLVLTPFKFPSGKNISCYECFNGSIDLEVTGGVGPYSYS